MAEPTNLQSGTNLPASEVSLMVFKKEMEDQLLDDNISADQTDEMAESNLQSGIILPASEVSLMVFKKEMEDEHLDDTLSSDHTDEMESAANFQPGTMVPLSEQIAPANLRSRTIFPAFEKVEGQLIGNTFSADQTDEMMLSCLPSGSRSTAVYSSLITPDVCSNLELIYGDENNDESAVDQTLDLGPIIKKFNCKYCSFGVNNGKGHLIQHMKKVHADEPKILDDISKFSEILTYSCDHCLFKTRRKSDLARHTKCHSGGKLFTCKCCSYGSNNESKIIPHMKKYHPEFNINVIDFRSEYKCDHCSFTTSRRSLLYIHLKSHNGGRQFTCEYCSFGSNYNAVVLKHMRIQHPDESLEIDDASNSSEPKIYTCDHCPYITTRKDNFNKHLECHSGGKQFICNFCSYGTNSKGNLVKHVNKYHDGETKLVSNANLLGNERQTTDVKDMLTLKHEVLNNFEDPIKSEITVKEEQIICDVSVN